jgi:hypothetical protein
VWSTKVYTFCYRRVGEHLSLAAALTDSIGFSLSNPLIGNFYQTAHQTMIERANDIDANTIAILMRTAIAYHTGVLGNDRREFDTAMHCHIDGDRMQAEGDVSNPDRKHACAPCSATWPATFSEI